MRLRDLSRVLAAHRLALPVLGTSSQQTVAGATATATHGTGARFQGLSSLIRSLELVTASGEVVRVSEGDNARMFAAARAGLGLLGVVAEVTLDCERAFNLRLVERPMTLSAVLDRLDEFLARNEHFKFWWWPHTHAVRTWEYNRTEDADTTAGRASHPGGGRARAFRRRDAHGRDRGAHHPIASSLSTVNAHASPTAWESPVRPSTRSDRTA
jgi:hypothetical protein